MAYTVITHREMEGDEKGLIVVDYDGDSDDSDDVCKLNLKAILGMDRRL